MAGNIFQQGMDAFDQGYDRVNTFRQDRAKVQAGRALSAGNYGDAAASLGQAGMIGPQTQLMDAQHERDLQDVQRRADSLLKVAQGLKTVPPGQREAALKMALPTLQQTGIDATPFATLDESHLTDQQLDQFSATLGKAVEEYTLAPGAARYRGTQKMAEQPLSPKYQVLKPGDTLVSTDPNDSPGQSVGGNAPAAAATGLSGSAPSAPLDSKTFVRDFVIKHEGGLNPADMNGSPTKYGINAKANPGVDVPNLTPDQAEEIYDKKYVPMAGVANLPPALAAVHIDTTVINPAKAKEFLQQSGGDPAKYMQLRQAWMEHMVATNPAARPYAKAWAQRNEDLVSYATTLANPPPTPPVEGAAATQQLGGARVIASIPKPPEEPAWKPDGKGNLINAKTGDRKVDPTYNGEGEADPALVKLLVEGRYPPPTTGRAATDPKWQAALKAAAAVDPTFNAADYTTRYKTRQDFTSGKSAQNITALNTVIGHLDHLDHSIDGLNNTDNLGPLNRVNNLFAHGIAEASGTDARIKDFETAKTAVANELTRVFRGTGGAEADIQGWMKQLDGASSPQALHKAVQSMATLIKSRLEALGEQYQQGLGQAKDPITLLTPDKQKAYQRMLGAAPAGQAAAPKGVRRYDQNGNLIQ